MHARICVATILVAIVLTGCNSSSTSGAACPGPTPSACTFESHSDFEPDRTEPILRTTDPGKATPDGRFDTPCQRLPIGTGSSVRFVPTCRVPLRRLLASPERYHGRVVSLQGTLVIASFGAEGYWALYPEEMTFRSSRWNEAVQLFDTDSTDIPARPGIYTMVSDVTVVGVYDARWIGQGFGGGLKLIKPAITISNRVDDQAIERWSPSDGSPLGIR